jgi:hypothetical protein
MFLEFTFFGSNHVDVSAVSKLVTTILVLESSLLFALDLGRRGRRIGGHTIPF